MEMISEGVVEQREWWSGGRAVEGGQGWEERVEK